MSKNKQRKRRSQGCEGIYHFYNLFLYFDVTHIKPMFPFYTFEDIWPEIGY